MKTHLFRNVRRFALVLAACAVLSEAAAVAQNHNASTGELWLLSTRSLPRCGSSEFDPAALDCRRMDDRGGWTAIDAAELLAPSDPTTPVAVFVHGNRVDWCTAIREGRSLFRVLRRAADARPFRLVIWSWPADQIRGVRNDAQVKAARSDVQAYYLAEWLDRMAPATPVNLVGHSFGGRVILGAMHLLGGGQLVGRSLAIDDGNRPERSIRAVVAAAAMDNASLLPGRRNELALARLERLLLTCNPCDPVLRWYPLMYRRGGPEALGYTGPACPAWLGESRERLDTLNVSCGVGKSHGWANYLGSRVFCDRVASYTFGL